MVEIQKEIKTFDFQKKYKNRLSRILQSATWLKVQGINYIAELNEAENKKIINTANGDVVLTSNFIYRLNPEFNVLTGTLYLTMYPTSNKIKKMVKSDNPLETPIFKVHIAATQRLPKTGQNIEENARFWAQDNGFYLKNGLENILNQIFSKLDQVLLNPNHLSEE